MGTGLYGALNRGPLAASFSAKLFLIAIIGATPLLLGGLTVALIDLGSAGLEAGVVLLGAILSVLAWVGMFKSVVRPLVNTRDALERYASKKTLPQLPTDGRDEVGVIMAHTQRSAVLLEDARRQRQSDRTTDPITGLINQRSAVRRLGQDILRAARDGRPLCLAMVAIDNIEELASQYPQESLDELSSSVSETIVKVIRRSDWVASHGNHDFLVGLWGVKADAALTALGRVATSLRDNPSRPVTLSIGIATVAPDQAPDVAIGNASNAMYKARTTGGNRIIVDV
ncbi:MAG: GGDEF domain-containing protein [Pseudomonadota bacterium]